MLIRRLKGWELPESAATPEQVFLNRRAYLAGSGAAMAMGAMAGTAMAQDADPTASFYPARRNETFKLDRDLTPESVNASFNNFYEFGSSKRVAAAAQALKARPWEIKIEGMVEKPLTIMADELITQMRSKLEERLYRLRCVEAWSMTIPWTGFPMKAFLDAAKPLSSAKYVRFDTFLDPKVATAQRQSWYPWPYSDSITIEEAANDLAFVVTGAYGKPLVKQHGAPIRITMPWKYGFKHVKSFTRVVFTDQRPKSFWESLQPAEYGFWGNINPEVSHPRWSQASEEIIGTGGKRVPTLLFNGYGEFVADLYKGLEKERLWS
ncbi:MAG: protein-methionine-sulfoxide reductase catalytic subunit MsrP [Beijerinckiaceae bacterium]